MQNSTNWIVHKETMIRLPAYNSVPVTQPVVLSGVYSRQTRPSARRVKPVTLLPCYGTTSSSTRCSFNQTITGTERSGKDYWPSVYGWGVSAPDFFADAVRTWDIPDYELVARANNKVISDLLGTSGQLANDILELRKTRDMVGDSLVALLRGFRDLRNGQPLKSLLKTLNKEGFRGLAGRKWLEYIYGWVPTIEGLYDTVDILSQELQEGKVIVRSVGTGLPIEYAGLSVNPKLYVTVSGLAKCRARYQFIIKDANLVRLRSLGVTNPAAILWEATPWSFVLDWGFRFGDYLQTLDYALGLSDIWVQHSIRRRFTWTATNILPRSPGYKLEPPGTALCSAIQCNRLAPTSSLSGSWKGFRNPFGSKNASTRLTSAMALLNQQLGHIGR